jgi:2-polyprenyl-3-methyl-5-hydroxy-6-metoxy-1,4-benzoquinol methylase
METTDYTKNRISSGNLSIFELDYIFNKNVINFLPKNKFTDVLDYGAGNSPWRDYIKYANYKKADISQNNNNDIDFILEIDKPIEILNKKFDLILLMDVLEHTPNIDFTLGECSRLCKDGGVLILSVPFIYRENETPLDFYRMTSFGLNERLKKHGFTVKKMKKIGNVFLTTYSLIYERNIKNGEIIRVSIIGKLFNKLLRILLPVLNKTLFIKNPNDDDSIYHHILIKAEKY